MSMAPSREDYPLTPSTNTEGNELALANVSHNAATWELHSLDTFPR